MKNRHRRATVLGALALLLLTAGLGWTVPNDPMPGVVDGVNGPAFTLAARTGYISTPDGNSVLIWGLAEGASPVQYPGPTLIVNQGDAVTVDLSNQLSVPVSLVFPGQAVTASEQVAPTQAGPCL